MMYDQSILLSILSEANIADASSLWDSIVLFGDHDLGSTRFG
jgi:hypothetical protein